MGAILSLPQTQEACRVANELRALGRSQGLTESQARNAVTKFRHVERVRSIGVAVMDARHVIRSYAPAVVAPQGGAA